MLVCLCLERNTELDVVDRSCMAMVSLDAKQACTGLWPSHTKDERRAGTVNAWRLHGCVMRLSAACFVPSCASLAMQAVLLFETHQKQTHRLNLQKNKTTDLSPHPTYHVHYVRIVSIIERSRTHVPCLPSFVLVPIQFCGWFHTVLPAVTHCCTIVILDSLRCLVYGIYTHLRSLLLLLLYLPR